MAKYRKKPVVIDAVQFNGEMTPELKSFLDNANYTLDFMSVGLTTTKSIPVLKINTLEGVMDAIPGDFIIKGVNGEYYPCKPYIFKQTYEKVEEQKELV